MDASPFFAVSWKTAASLVISILLGIWSIRRFGISHRRTVEEIGRWAKERNFRVVSLEQPLIVPILWPSRGHRHFRVTLEGNEGQMRYCWISSPTGKVRRRNEDLPLHVKWIDDVETAR